MYSLSFIGCSPGSILHINSPYPQSSECIPCSVDGAYSLGGTDTCSIYGFYVSANGGDQTFTRFIIGDFSIDGFGRLNVDSGGSGWTGTQVALSPVCSFLFVNSLIDNRI